MTGKLSWAAPIEPGRQMMGLTLGMSEEEVWTALGLGDDDLVKEVAFVGGPSLIVDSRKSGVIYLRTPWVKDATYEWQDKVGRLVFAQGVLTNVIAQLVPFDECPDVYAGRFGGDFGLQSPVSAAKRFGSLEYDDAEEVFYIPGLEGLEFAGSNSCDLSLAPEQYVTFLRVFQS
ncbi:hypothetical protein [Dyella sp.]|uniref:hypothetical protein n=1 Tax=Dyella sp. TaxID=1869338 RepID=UPI00284333BD|nr:hypothetical protein [Dyella sp.]MDR3447492.1 hypothetical protein [Dyella sp.]